MTTRDDESQMREPADTEPSITDEDDLDGDDENGDDEDEDDDNEDDLDEGDEDLISPEEIARATSQVAETTAQAAILASWIGWHRIAWLGLGADLARRPDPDLADAMFLRVDDRLYSIQPARDADGQICPRIRVRRWGRAASRGARPGGAVHGARRAAPHRWSTRCDVSIDMIFTGAPVLVMSEAPHSLSHAGTTWEVGAHQIFSPSPLQMILLSEDPAARTTQGVTLVARIPTGARSRRMILAGQTSRWTVDQIERDEARILFSQVPAEMFSASQVDTMVDFATGPCEIRVSLTTPEPLADLHGCPIYGVILCDPGRGSRSLHAVIDLGPERRTCRILGPILGPLTHERGADPRADRDAASTDEGTVPDARA